MKKRLLCGVVLAMVLACLLTLGVSAAEEVASGTITADLTAIPVPKAGMVFIK